MVPSLAIVKVGSKRTSVQFTETRPNIVNRLPLLRAWMSAVSRLPLSDNWHNARLCRDAGSIPAGEDGFLLGIQASGAS